jgi:hypothetical protein
MLGSAEKTRGIDEPLVTFERSLGRHLSEGGLADFQEFANSLGFERFDFDGMMAGGVAHS